MRSLLWLAAAAPLFAGELSQRFDLTVHRLTEGGPPEYNLPFLLADAAPQHTRRFTNFSGDVSGRYIGALAAAAEVSGRNFPSLDRLIDGLLPLQKADGHFGDPLSTGVTVTNNDMAIMWGNGRLLIGLMEYQHLHPRAEVLAAARKLGDFVVAQAPLYNSEAVRREFNGEKFAVGYICWTQHIEGLVALWEATHDNRYLALARELAARTERKPAQHSHGYLTTVRGLLDLARATSDRKYVEQAAREWQGVVDSGNALMQGAVPEMFAPSIKRDEGCSEADWLRLSLSLWRATGDAKFIEQAELALFNEFRMNQFASGDFGHHTLTANGVGEPSARAWWCCTMHGLRAMAAVLAQAFRMQDVKLWYDLPVDARIRTQGLEVRAESSLERDGSVRLTIVSTDGAPHTLAVRQPRWAQSVEPREVTKSWKEGEQLTIRYTMRTRLVRSQKGAPRVAIFHGPWLLGVDSTASPNYFDEPAAQNRALVPAGAEITLPAAADGKFAHFRLRYLPGGYPMQPLDALLRPVAEYTYGPDAARVDWWLPVQPEAEKQDSLYRP